MRAVVFDLDGTLIHSGPDIMAALNRTLVAYKLAPLPWAEVQFMIGDGAKVLVEKGFAARGMTGGPEEVAVFLKDYNVNAVVETIPYPGIVESLTIFREAGRKLAVCTNKPAWVARHILETLGLAVFFSEITGGDSTPYRKPDPRHLAATLATLDCAEAVMVGDHENDMAAALGCGIPSIFAAWGYGKAVGTHTAGSAYDLPAIVASL
jgi:phosphoglycolate phosphatase